MNENRELENRFVGTLFGQAVGDALGLGTEYMSKKDVAWYYPNGLISYDQIIQDAHRMRWTQGSWTDDTDQMTMILDSLLEMGKVNIQDIARRFWNWAFVARGEGIGNTTYSVLNYPDFIKDPHAASKAVWEDSSCHLAANGGVMRTSVVGLWDFNDNKKIVENAEAICKITHYDPRCVGSCVVISLLINGLVKGRNPDNKFFDEILAISKMYDNRIQPFIETALNANNIDLLSLDSKKDMGYTLKTLSAGIWSLSHASTFEDGLLPVILEGGDADTNGAVAGALLGARFGVSSIPKKWIEELRCYRYLNRVSQELFSFESSMSKLPEKLRDLRATVISRRGQTCIYREKILILPCTLESSIADSWGVRLTLKPIEAKGFLYPLESTLSPSVAWGWGSISDSEWSGGQAGGWTIYFDEDLFRSLKQVALQFSGLETIDRWRRLADHINNWGLSADFDQNLPKELNQNELEFSYPSLSDEEAKSTDYVDTQLDLQLDLAAAYLDMGDSVGARLLFEEIIKKGDARQKQQAEAMFKKLD